MAQVNECACAHCMAPSTPKPKVFDDRIYANLFVSTVDCRLILCKIAWNRIVVIGNGMTFLQFRRKRNPKVIFVTHENHNVISNQFI